MSKIEFRREYLPRLPLPLAQLYSRAFNAKDVRSQHDNTFYLLEALIKLLASVLAGNYLSELRAGGTRVGQLDRCLARLALPSLGQWLEILRTVARYYGERPDCASLPCGHLWKQLNRSHADRPALTALYRRIKNGPDGAASSEDRVSIVELFDALVQYRNGVFGHGGPRFASFYEDEMGPLLFPAVNELLEDGCLDILGPSGSRLVYVTELRILEDDLVEVGLDELTDRESLRMAALRLTSTEAAQLIPNCVGLLYPGRRAPLRLDPLLVFRGTNQGDEVLFLNRDRQGRQVEYLSYTTGRTERDKSMSPALAKLLSLITGRAVDEEDLEHLSQQTQSETSSVEHLFEPVQSSGHIRGDYEIVAELGRGGMGVVYLARQLSLGRLVALKTLPADLAGDENALGRFRRETRALSRCDHPNIVRLLSSGTFQDGQLFYTMEYVSGCDLEQVWREVSDSQHAPEISSLGGSAWRTAVWNAARKHRDVLTRRNTGDATPGQRKFEAAGANKPAAAVEEIVVSRPDVLPPLPQLPSVADDPGGYARRIAQLIRDAAQGLQAVHEQRLIHRDISPANLMVTSDGQRLVLMDFGLAKSQTQSTQQTQAGGLLGKLRYAAPEQLASGHLSVGPAADVRGLGVTMWELLARRRLFEQAQDEVQLAHLVHDVDVPKLRTIDSSIDPDLEAIVARACERSVTDRISSAARMAEYLDLFLNGQRIPLRVPPVSELLVRWLRSHRQLTGIVALCFLAVVLTVIAAFGWVLGERNDAVKAKNNAVEAEKNKSLALKKEQDALKNEQDARANAVSQRRSAEARAMALARQEVRAGVRTALSYVLDGDETGALLWLAEALRHAEEAWQTASSDPATDKQTLASLEAERDRARQRLELAVRQFPLQQFWANARVATFDAAGQRVAVGSNFSGVAVYDANSGDLLFPELWHSGKVRWLAFHPDGKRLITISGDNAWVWTLEKDLKANVQPTMLKHPSVVRHARLLSAEQIVTGAEDGMIRVWNIAQPEKPKREFQAGRSIAFSETGKFVLADSRPSFAAPAPAVAPAPAPATCAPDNPPIPKENPGELRLWNVSTGEAEKLKLPVEEGCEILADLCETSHLLAIVARTPSIAMTVSEDVGISKPAFTRQRLSVYDWSGPKTLVDEPDLMRYVNVIRLAQNGKSVAVGFESGHVAYASLDSTLNGGSGFLNDQLSGPNNYFEAMPGPGPLPLDEPPPPPPPPPECQPARGYAAPYVESSPPPRPPNVGGPFWKTIKNPWPVGSVQYAPDGERLAVGLDRPNRADKQVIEGETQLWDLKSGMPLTSRLPHSGRASTLQFSLGGRLLVAGGWEGTGEARVWNLAEAQTWSRRIDNCAGGVFSKSGDVLYGNRGDQPTAWNLQTGQTIPLPPDAKTQIREFESAQTVQEMLTKQFSIENEAGFETFLTRNVVRFRTVLLVKQLSVTAPSGEELSWPYDATHSGKKLDHRSHAINQANNTELRILQGRVQFSKFGASAAPAAGPAPAPPIEPAPPAPGCEYLQPNTEKGEAVTAEDPKPNDDPKGGEKKKGKKDDDEDNQLIPITPYLRHSARITNTSLNDDGTYCCSCCADGTVWVWHVATAEPLTWSLRQPAQMGSLALDPRGRHLVATELRTIDFGQFAAPTEGPSDRSALVWDLTPKSRRTVAEWTRLVELLAMRRLDETQQIAQLSSADVVSRWELQVMQDRGPTATAEWLNEKLDYYFQSRMLTARIAGLEHLVRKPFENDKKRAEAHAELALCLLVAGQMEKSEATVASGLKQTPNDLELSVVQALLQLRRADGQGYQATCTAALKLHLQSADDETLFALGFLCSLGPNGLADWNPVLERVKKLSDAHLDQEGFAVRHGALLYRAGKFEEASRVLRRAVAQYLLRQQQPIEGIDALKEFAGDVEITKALKTPRKEIADVADAIVFLALVQERLKRDDATYWYGLAQSNSLRRIRGDAVNDDEPAYFQAPLSWLATSNDELMVLSIDQLIREAYEVFGDLPPAPAYGPAPGPGPGYDFAPAPAPTEAPAPAPAPKA